MGRVLFLFIKNLKKILGRIGGMLFSIFSFIVRCEGAFRVQNSKNAI